MEELIYNNIGPVFQLNKAGELVQKRMKAAKVCEGLFVTEPDKSGYTQFICELNGVVWLDCKAAANRIADGAKMLPDYFEKIKSGAFDGENVHEFKREISRRINRPDAPAIMELKQPERKKCAPLAAKGQNVEAEDGGTIRAKVLQYKSDGNTLTEKWETLTKYAEGIYYSYSNLDKYGHKSINVIFAKGGVYWRKTGAPEYYFNPDSFNYAENMENLKRMYADHEADILQAAANGGRLNSLHITVMERLGHDVAPLRAAYEERKRKWQEVERQRIEAAEKAEQERKEAEERRRAELLADGKEKLMSNKAVTVEQIELLAEAVGYKIHIRTIGFMRKKVSEAVLNPDDIVTVWGYKLTQRNISGVVDVLRAIVERLRALAEEVTKEVQQSATPSETPQISTESTESANVSGQSEKREIKHISEIMETCRLHDDNGEITDEYKYYNWLAYATGGNYRTIAEKALTEAWINIFQAAYRRGKGHILAMNTRGELVDTVFVSAPQLVSISYNLPRPPKQTPQSRQTFPAVNYAAPMPKARETARKRQNSAVRDFRTTANAPPYW